MANNPATQPQQRDSQPRNFNVQNQSAQNQREADRQNIEEAIGILFEPQQVVEVRVPKAGKYGTVSGYFIDHKKLAQKLEELSGNVGAVYYTLNPVNPALLARAHNRTRTYAKDTTNDAPDNIVKRRWLLVDCDPVRPADISATDEEKTAAKRLVPKIKKYLEAAGWPVPVVADSGNGYHLLYRVDLPNDDESRKLVESVLKALAARFDTNAVKIDQKVFNSSRITKAYGTKACKGDSISERPHRLSQMFAPPEGIEIVSKALLTALAAEAPTPEKKKSSPTAKTPGGWTPALVEQVLDEADVGRGEAMDYKGSTKWQHDCLANPDHRKPDAFTILDADGFAHHYCSHNTCSDMRDEDWRSLWEERTGEAYPWPKRKLGSGVNGDDTMPESPYLSPKGSFRESVSTSDTTSDSVRHSDVGNAMRLAKLCGEDIIYCRQSDEYYVWDGTRWMRDLNNVDMLRLAKTVTEEMFQEAESLGEDAKKALRSHALKSQSVARLSGMVNLAKIHVRNVNRGDFDKDPWVFNCATGTIDLRTGKCVPHDRKDLISKLAPVKYDPAADCPLWKKCLTDWMLGDEQKVGYLQRQAGYTLTGCTNEEVMPIFWGAGNHFVR